MSHAQEQRSEVLWKALERAIPDVRDRVKLKLVRLAEVARATYALHLVSAFAWLLCQAELQLCRGGCLTRPKRGCCC